MQHDGRRCEPTLGAARRALNQPMPFKPQMNFLPIFLVANLHVLELFFSTHIWLLLRTEGQLLESEILLCTVSQPRIML